MKKFISETERKLQKKLIPLNIFVCILCLVSIASLFFAPIFKLDFGRIMRSPDMQAYVEEMMDKTIDGSLEGSEQEGVNYAPVVTTIVSSVLGQAQGSVAVSGFNAAKVAFSSAENKADAVLDELFFNDTALVGKLVDSIVDGVVGMFKTDEGKGLVEEIVVGTITTELIKEVNSENLTEEKVKQLLVKFKEIEKVSGGETTVEEVANGLIDEIAVMFEDEVSIGPEERQNIVDEMEKIYADAVAEAGDGAAVTLETLICVTVSKNVDLNNYNIDDIFDKLFSGANGGEQTVPAALAVEEGETPPADKTICTTYDELLDAMGLNEEKTEELKTKLRASLRAEVDKALEGTSDMFKYYGYVFYGVLGLVLPWFVLFLFAFFRMFAKNKRFMMWYAKLFGIIPGIISLAVLLAPRLLPVLPFTKSIFEGEQGPAIKAMLYGLTSATWICGVCYILLWLASVIWAFPIKRKIRKERKFCKNGGGYGEYPAADAYGVGAAGGYPAAGYNADGFDDYASDYDLGFGYGSDFGSDYGSGYGSDYGSDFGYDSYGSDYGSGYGSSIFDDDDDDLY